MSAEGGGSEGVLMRSRVSAEQLELLLSFMQEHPDFAAGKQSVYSRFSASKLWRLLAERLNAAAADSGGARKSPDKWCRYWADIKYKARKKCAAGGALGDLSSVEERLQTILNGAPASGGGSGAGARRGSHSDEERKPPGLGLGALAGLGALGALGAGLEDDACSDASGGAHGPGAAGGDARLATEELLAEAAMRQALAAEKQAEAVAQGVELLRELVGLVRERWPPPQQQQAQAHQQQQQAQHAAAQVHVHAHQPQQHAHAEHAALAVHSVGVPVPVPNVALQHAHHRL